MLTRPPAVAGVFYPDDPVELGELIDRLLGDNAQRGQAPRALVVPHAGLVYSGPVAARAYSLLRPWVSSFDRVLLLGPNHRVPLASMAVPSAGSFACPLGEMALDTETIADWVERGLLEYNDEPHRLEHCLEVQLPFLLRLKSDWKLIPVVVGQVATDRVAALVREALRNERTLVLVSSDLSHYHSYDTARRIDSVTSQRIERMEPTLTPELACGCHALNGLLDAAGRQGLHIDRLDLRNSGDTAGPRDRVVGYGAYAIH
ncbi:MEMO1 family protein [Marinobacterium nitratireducens]|uniref:MEMO1 family protein GCM10011348_02470 n=1 Tax=Marinobacterium nitratireducens TaxID=518897 RepID=A0A917Z6G5_9GAMM|nr:AmmeMemoRadiSam system protein B [Marinobacterium nitratireducens]GGO76089.1 MEMO1 family protein [Marinobacterium nitratireducens]